MLGGRDFTDAELAPGSSEQVAIIDDALAGHLWPHADVLGRQIQFLDGPAREVGQPMRVVGIVPAVKHALANPRPFPHVYVPLGQRYESAMTRQLRIADEDAEPAMLKTVADVIRNVDARVPALRVESCRDHLDAGVELWIYRVTGLASIRSMVGISGEASSCVKTASLR